MKTQTKYLIGLGIVVVLAVSGAFLFRGSSNKQPTAKVSRGDLVEAAYSVGTVRADQVFNLKTGASSRVMKRFVRLGDRVKKNDPLILLDGFPLYRSPFDGVVTTLAYNEGELVFGQTNILTVTNDDTLYMQLTLDERTVWAIKAGQEARISFEGQRDKVKIGKVRSVYANDSEFNVLIDFDTKGMSLLPGMTADVAVVIEVHHDQLLVPVGALNTKNEVSKAGHHPSTLTVKVGANDGKYAIVTSDDLKEGDDVLVRKTASNNSSFGP